MKWIVAYFVCPLVGGFIIWRKQGKYLTDQQPLAFLLLGPLMPLIALLPRRFFANQKGQEGKK